MGAESLESFVETSLLYSLEQPVLAVFTCVHIFVSLNYDKF